MGYDDGTSSYVLPSTVQPRLKVVSYQEISVLLEALFSICVFVICQQFRASEQAAMYRVEVPSSVTLVVHVQNVRTACLYKNRNKYTIHVSD